jgi:hypothetical protein
MAPVAQPGEIMVVAVERRGSGGAPRRKAEAAR